jgi:hypothetical protein
MATPGDPLTKRRTGLPGRFVEEVIDGVRRERSTEVAAAVEAVVHGERAEDLPGQRAAQYFALCERAWLHWSRLALDAITTHTLGQVTLGPFHPARVRDSEDAALAEVRCGLHGRLLDVASERVDDPDWPWRMEAARQIHVSTQKALRFAARISAPRWASANQLRLGTSCAVDAIVTAIAAGFVADAPAEVRETVDAMVRGGSRSAKQSAGDDESHDDEVERATIPATHTQPPGGAITRRPTRYKPLHPAA